MIDDWVSLHAALLIKFSTVSFLSLAYLGLKIMYKSVALLRRNRVLEVQNCNYIWSEDARWGTVLILFTCRCMENIWASDSCIYILISTFAYIFRYLRLNIYLVKSWLLVSNTVNKLVINPFQYVMTGCYFIIQCIIDVLQLPLLISFYISFSLSSTLDPKHPRFVSFFSVSFRLRI
jgi:hypothetical protein